ncbi:hypothetical protein FHG87_001091 [Trinorchestia longiramus]|nr:hypothetical protein FHG87_001091 [Trinorchestia longiramus]
MNMSQEERELHLQIMGNRDQESRNDMNEVERQQFLENRRNRCQERRNDMIFKKEILRYLPEGNDHESSLFRKTSGITAVHSPLRLLESNCAFLLEEVSIASTFKARLITQQICTDGQPQYGQLYIICRGE